MENSLFTLISTKGKYYSLDDYINGGRHSSVFKGYCSNDEKKEHPLAIKVLQPEMETKKAANMIAREVYFLQKTESDSVVKYIDHSLTIEEPYLVMEFVPNTLNDLVKKNSITQEVVTDYLQQIPEILMNLKKSKVLHCDLKCSNLGYNDRKIKLLDFGVAILFEHSFFRRVKEVPNYNSPELRDDSWVTSTSDIYSAGKVLEFMLTGKLEESAEDSLDNIELIYNKNLPDSFKTIFSSMVDEDFAVRPNPQQLKEMANVAVEDLKKDTYFTPEVFTFINKEKLSSYPADLFF